MSTHVRFSMFITLFATTCIDISFSSCPISVNEFQISRQSTSQVISLIDCVDHLDRFDFEIVRPIFFCHASMNFIYK